jgi:TRAP-type C4-dicarboxylate transport system permease small subunit
VDRGASPARRGLAGAVDTAATLWALAGGVLLLVIVLLNAWSILANALLGGPFTGAFELTEAGVAVAVFSFLPFCQLTGANVTADIFTARAPRRWIAAFGVLAAVVALGFALLLAQRMWLGLIDQKSYNLTTAILQMPIWWAFVPIVASLALLALAALVSLVEAARELGRA